MTKRKKNTAYAVATEETVLRVVSVTDLPAHSQIELHSGRGAWPQNEDSRSVCLTYYCRAAAAYRRYPQHRASIVLSHVVLCVLFVAIITCPNRLFHSFVEIIAVILWLKDEFPRWKVLRHNYFGWIRTDEIQAQTIAFFTTPLSIPSLSALFNYRTNPTLVNISQNTSVSFSAQFDSFIQHQREALWNYGHQSSGWEIAGGVLAIFLFWFPLLFSS